MVQTLHQVGIKKKFMLRLDLESEELGIFDEKIKSAVVKAVV